MFAWCIDLNLKINLLFFCNFFKLIQWTLFTVKLSLFELLDNLAWPACVNNQLKVDWFELLFRIQIFSVSHGNQITDFMVENFKEQLPIQHGTDCKLNSLLITMASNIQGQYQLWLKLVLLWVIFNSSWNNFNRISEPVPYLALCLICC